MRLARTASALAILACLVAPGPVAAHPLGNFTINRAIIVEIGAQVDIRYLIDMAEIPAFEALQQLDTDDDGTSDPDEADVFASSICADARAALMVTVDAGRVVLAEAAPPLLSFLPGVGGLETLRLECSFVVDGSIDSATDHRLEVSDRTDTSRIGWREATARARGNASVSQSDVPEVSPSAELTAYPEDPSAPLTDVRGATLTFRLDEDADGSQGLTPAPPNRRNPADPLAALIGGDLSPPVITLALLLAAGLGALHALSPGHGKTLVAAYVLGAGGNARSAVQIGLSVAVSHTAGVFALGMLTLLASELFLPERVIGWLSLVSGLIVAVLGLVLLARQWPRIRRATLVRRGGGPAHPPHVHGEADGHQHDQDHGHTHEVPAGSLTWRSALALGFAGGAVPSASAVIVLLVAISSDRLAFGSLLIVMFGAGMAVVLGGLGLIIARVGSAASRADHGWLASSLARRIGGWVPLVAGIVVFFTGVAFTLTAAAQLS